MRIISYLILILILSCQKENPIPQQPTVVPMVGDTIPVNDTTYSLMGQKWVVVKYRVGELGEIININDTLDFITKNTYVFNGNKTYHLTFTSSALNLSLYQYRWGNMSGGINMYMIELGEIYGIKFKDITPGNSNQVDYYLWMEKI
jgi:hypothetical protein